MPKIVFDASAILALIQMEKGYENVSKRLEDAVVSSVNFSEVVTVLSRNGYGQDEVIKSLESTFLNIEVFDTKQAITAASLDQITKKHGLSFGDRACLALAKNKNLPILTADKVWKKLELNIHIEVIR